MPPLPPVSRRLLLQMTAAAAALSACTKTSPVTGLSASRVRPLPLASVRLRPSLYRDAMHANRAYLHRLEPDRLLHDYHLQAGLAPKGERYGGWERETIAGHSLGHYLTACALMHVQADDDECRRRVHYIVGELAQCQRAAHDGFVGAFTRRAEASGAIEPGRRVMEEIARGDIRSARFYLNGCWAPFYNWHKLLAGLLDAEAHCGSAGALEVCTQLAAFIERTLSRLDRAQVQSILGTEFGGMGEVLADLGARTGEARWLRLAGRFHHEAVLAPLLAGRDELAHLHANTQIPKLIGLARQSGISGDPSGTAGARFFWHAVTQGRSYVIGGNSDRETFQEPGSISRYITEQTCESCNTYNMLKLTRLLFAAEPVASYFDYYERAHLNHILAQQRRPDGAFAYMMPLMSGAAREWSEPFDSFWCCVGTGMESHSKHGDSVYWEDGETLYVNLFVPSELNWSARGVKLTLDGGYPFADGVSLRVDDPGGPAPFTLATRLPGWCEVPTVRVNDKPVDAGDRADGYFRARRAWRAGDTIELHLPMPVRLEQTPDDPATVAVLQGPLVLAADLGPSNRPFQGPAPALVGDELLRNIVPAGSGAAMHEMRGISRPADLQLQPFLGLHDRRTAVYFRRHSPAEWQAALGARDAERERQEELDARSVDVVRLGVADDERRRALASEISYAVSYRFRPGRDARTGGFFEFDAAVRDVPLVLRATYWGGERERFFHVLVDGERIATQQLQGEHPGEFIDRDYRLPVALLTGKSTVRVRFQPERGFTAGPVFGCRILAPEVSRPV